MAFLKFNKAELVNLSYSLKREIISANKTGAYLNTSIVTCNTRRYHGLLAAPIGAFDEGRHILLSSLDESLVIGGKQFNLGIHKYGDIYEPRGHKYIIDFGADPVPEITYKVGDVIFAKTLVLAPDKSQVMIRYEVRQAAGKVGLQLKPFLAFRNIHALTHKNPEADTSYKEVKNGVSFCLYRGYPDLNLQFSSPKAEFNYQPCWYDNITYSDEARRGFDCSEDLFVPGHFCLEMRQGESVVFSASVAEVGPTMLTKKFKEAVEAAPQITSFHDQLVHCATQLKRVKNGHKMITAGFSWMFTGLLRETLIALPGLTLYADGNKEEFEEILDNLIADNQERFFKRTTQVEAPLYLACILQQYIEFGADARKVWRKYGKVMRDVIESYGPGKRKEVALQPNGLLWAQMDHTALTWMNAYIDGNPVTERAGYQVETNALWFNALCFVLDMELKYCPRSLFLRDWSDVRAQAAYNYQPMFWNPANRCLADYVDNNGQNQDIRPNQIFAIWVPYSPVDDDVARSVVSVMAKELVTRRGVRTLSPRDYRYKGVYEGTQMERDLAYHQGCAWPWLLYHYIETCLKMNGSSFIKKAEWLVEGFFYEDLNKHGVGCFSELYDGDPPHEPHGAISSALSTASLLGVEYLIDKYKED